MSNRIASITAPASAPAFPRFAIAAVLAASFVALGGCNANTAPPLPLSTQAASPAADSVRYRMDPARNRMWVLTHDRVVLNDIATSKKIEIDLPGWQWADTPYACLPDLALGPRGEAVITSNVVPTLWRIDPETLAVSVHNVVLDADRGRDVGFSGLAYSMKHGAFFAVSDTHSSLWRIDPLLRTGQEVSLSDLIRRTGTCEAPLVRVPREAD